MSLLLLQIVRGSARWNKLMDAYEDETGNTDEDGFIEWLESKEGKRVVIHRRRRVK